jgi:peptidoglycan-associated lipoprotein
MANTTARIAIAIALAAGVAGCAKKKPDVLPPAPPAQGQGATGDYTPPAPSTPTGTAVVPGSREDFLQTAGSDTVNFATDSYDIDGQASSILDGQARWLQQYPAKTITLEGHCDERGTREYNLALGDRRATAAKNYLVSRGVAASRINTVSYGKERPLATGSDESAWAQNRRAVTVLVN